MYDSFESKGPNFPSLVLLLNPDRTSVTMRYMHVFCLSASALSVQDIKAAYQAVDHQPAIYALFFKPTLRLKGSGLQVQSTLLRIHIHVSCLC